MLLSVATASPALAALVVVVSFPVVSLDDPASEAVAILDYAFLVSRNHRSAVKDEGRAAGWRMMIEMMMHSLMGE